MHAAIHLLLSVTVVNVCTLVNDEQASMPQMKYKTIASVYLDLDR